MGMDEKVIATQKQDATSALVNHAQVQMLEAECTRNTQMATAQFQQTLMQSKMQLEMQYKEQTMQLDSAKMQREMAISQQAAQMTAQAQQTTLQMEMQEDDVLVHGPAEVSVSIWSAFVAFSRE